MLVIRLTRKGKKNQPFFRVVLIDKRRSSKGGRAVEDLGFKNPLTKKVSLKKDRILYWIKCGAKPSPTVHNLLVSEKILDAKKIAIKIKKKAQAATPAPAAAPAVAQGSGEVKPTTQVAPEAKTEEKPAEQPKPE
jgi:small subunit ribosomal protein S16